MLVAPRQRTFRQLALSGGHALAADRGEVDPAAEGLGCPVGDAVTLDGVASGLSGAARSRSGIIGEVPVVLAGLTVAGLTVAGLTVAGLTVAGLTVAGLTVAGLTAAGLSGSNWRAGRRGRCRWT